MNFYTRLIIVIDVFLICLWIRTGIIQYYIDSLYNKAFPLIDSLPFEKMIKSYNQLKKYSYERMLFIDFLKFKWTYKLEDFGIDSNTGEVIE